MNYKLELCNDLTNWSNFIKKSKQFNVFASSQFLKNKFKEYEAYFFYKDNIILIGCLFKKDLNSKNNEMYQNIFYSNFFDKINISKSLKLKIESTDELLKQLYMKFKNIKLCLHHSIKDIRAFQWFNYHEKNNKFHINIKYTALLDLKPYIDFSEYFNQIRASRRQDYNKSIKNILKQ